MKKDIARFARSSKYCSVHRTEPERIKCGWKEGTDWETHPQKYGKRERGKERNVTGAVHIKT